MPNGIEAPGKVWPWPPVPMNGSTREVGVGRAVTRICIGRGSGPMSAEAADTIDTARAMARNAARMRAGVYIALRRRFIIGYDAAGRPHARTEAVMPNPVSRLAIATFVLLLAAGCGGSSPKTAASGAPAGGKKIGITLLTEQHGFYQALRGGLEQAAGEKGYQLFVTSGEFDATRQANQVDEFIAQKVDAIVVCPCDSRAVGASIAQANQASIPVFTADIANASGMGKVIAHIASDNREGGRRAGELMAQALGGKGTVAIITHPQVTSVQDRVAGFKESIAKYPEIHVVAELSAEGKRDRAVKVMEDILQSNPKLDGVFGINDDSALGALAAIEAAGKSGKIKIVGYDANPEAQEKIKAGAIYGDVMQDPARIGQLTIDAIAKHFAGAPVDSVVPVPVGEFTAKAP